MATYYLLLTQYGATRIAAAHDNQDMHLTTLHLGDANLQPYVPESRVGFNTLLNKRAEVDLASVTVQGMQVVVTALIPGTIGGFNLHEIGLADETGNLLYVGNFHGGYKPQASEGAAGDITLELRLETNGLATVIVEMDNMTVGATKQWVSDNFVTQPNFTLHANNNAIEHATLQAHIDTLDNSLRDIIAANTSVDNNQTQALIDLNAALSLNSLGDDDQTNLITVIQAMVAAHTGAINDEVTNRNSAISTAINNLNDVPYGIYGAGSYAFRVKPGHKIRLLLWAGGGGGGAWQSFNSGGNHNYVNHPALSGGEGEKSVVTIGGFSCVLGGGGSGITGFFFPNSTKVRGGSLKSGEIYFYGNQSGVTYNLFTPPSSNVNLRGDVANNLYADDGINMYGYTQAGGGNGGDPGPGENYRSCGGKGRSGTAASFEIDNSNGSNSIHIGVSVGCGGRGGKDTILDYNADVARHIIDGRRGKDGCMIVLSL